MKNVGVPTLRVSKDDPFPVASDLQRSGNVEFVFECCEAECECRYKLVREARAHSCVTRRFARG